MTTVESRPVAVPPSGPRVERTIPAARSTGITCSSTERGASVVSASSSSLSGPPSASARASTARVA